MDKRAKRPVKDAFSLFPEVMERVFTAGHKLELADYDGLSSSESIPLEKDLLLNRSNVIPPLPPDLSFLQDEVTQSGERAYDVPIALILLPEERTLETAVDSLRNLGYQPESVRRVDEAIGRLMSGGCATLIMDVDFEGTGVLEQSRVHSYMTGLPMARRRSIFYVLVGDFQTLYDMEALAMSVNLVVNRADMEYLRAILKKGYRDYEEIFGPLLEVLGIGKLVVGESFSRNY